MSNPVNTLEEEFASFKNFTNAQRMMVNGKMDSCIEAIAGLMKAKAPESAGEEDNPWGDGKWKRRVPVRNLDARGILGNPKDEEVPLRRRPIPRDEEGGAEEKIEVISDEQDDLRHLTVKVMMPWVG